ncbi:hypothetical protein BACCOPRO_01617 [Phocaeicola coprophilus DSM 18228 = JCM 13818]|uniref:Uncharacterized protein n=1 Tax=Phocaeicola coprophilus DSM 18228 = JCM 13818 TaxID=547042 RepID=S0F7S7_9BACT|nr:hypothetical protein BACCOPRO_01617 [Phocaeicola coprophilus DSM 18228 = JCM 13818]
MPCGYILFPSFSQHIHFIFPCLHLYLLFQHSLFTSGVAIHFTAKFY